MLEHFQINYKIFLMRTFKAIKIFWVFHLGVIVIACQPLSNYDAYRDVKQKGKQIFKRNLQNCQIRALKITKRSEGSEGAGERMKRERFILKKCMRKNNWISKS